MSERHRQGLERRRLERRRLGPEHHKLGPERHRLGPERRRQAPSEGLPDSSKAFIGSHRRHCNSSVCNVVLHLQAIILHHA